MCLVNTNEIALACQERKTPTHNTNEMKNNANAGKNAPQMQQNRHRENEGAHACRTEQQQIN